MKSFICSTDAGDMILTVKYNQEHQNFKLYLNGIQSSFFNNGLNFYSDNNSCPPPTTIQGPTPGRFGRSGHSPDAASGCLYRRPRRARPWNCVSFRSSPPDGSSFRRPPGLLWTDVSSKDQILCKWISNTCEGRT